MMITIKTSAKGRCKALVEGNMTIYEAAADKPVLLSALAKASELEVDVSSLRDMDTAGLQLLILLKRESLKANTAMRLVGHSSALCEVLTTYNMTAYFADPVTSRAQQKMQPRQFR
jgi:ABC-type transporter Mla MlaB component